MSHTDGLPVYISIQHKLHSSIMPPQANQEGLTIAIAKLEVRRGVQESVAELVLQLPEALVPGRDALIARQEVVLYLLIPVDVTQEVHPAASG